MWESELNSGCGCQVYCVKARWFSLILLFSCLRQPAVCCTSTQMHTQTHKTYNVGRSFDTPTHTHCDLLTFTQTHGGEKVAVVGCNSYRTQCVCVFLWRFFVDFCWCKSSHNSYFIHAGCFLFFLMFSVYSSITLKPSIKPDYQIQILFESLIRLVLV